MLCPLNVLAVISMLSPPTGGPGQAYHLSLLQSPELTLVLAPGPWMIEKQPPEGGDMFSLGCVYVGSFFFFSFFII